MKQISKLLALILALLMLVSALAACGEKKDETGSDTKSDETEAVSEATEAPSEEKTEAVTEAATEAAPAPVVGEEQTWGEITVSVPDSMDMQGGSFGNSEDLKSTTLNDKDNAANYIIVTIVDSEESARSNVEMSKSVNETYHPEDISFTAGGGSWEGITYDAHGIVCTNAFAVIGDKVFSVLAAGHAYDSDVMQMVLGSLK